MKLLLDTHAFLWFSLNDPKLSSVARATIVDPRNSTSVSVGSLWEIAIKVRLGNLRLLVPFDSIVREAYTTPGLDVLHIQPQHLLRLAQLPFHHRDPFDRLFVSQVLSDSLTLVSADEILDAYGIQRIW